MKAHIGGIATCIALLISLAGCGGDGGNNPPPPVDSTPPDTTLAGTPASPTNSTSASITLISTEGGSSFQTSVDGAAFAATANPLALTGLSEGQHTVSARAIDPAGNMDATPVTFTWRIDTSPPAAAVSFPTSVSYTDATSLHVRGTATDTSAISAVTINGSAVTTTDGFRNWSAVVPVVAGPNVFTVATTDSVGNSAANARSFAVENRSYGASNITDVAMDRTSSTPVIYTANNDFLWRTALATGTTTLVLDHRPLTPLYSSRLIMNPYSNVTQPNGLLYLFQDNAMFYYAVDLNTGSSASTSGPAFLQSFVRVHSLTADFQNHRILYVWDEGPYPMAIRSTAPGVVGAGLVSQPTIQGAGPAWGAIRGIGVAEAQSSGRLYVSDDAPAFFSVDPVTGDRSIASANGGPGTGMNLLPFQDISVNRAGTLAIGLRAPTLQAVDIISGNRTLISGLNPDDSTQKGSGPLIASTVLEVDFANSLAFVRGGEFFVVVDLVSGDRVGIPR